MGFGRMTGLDYEGSDENKIQVFPMIAINWNGTFSLGMDGLGISLITSDFLTIMTGIGYDFGRKENENIAFDGLVNNKAGIVSNYLIELSLGPLSTSRSDIQYHAQGKGRTIDYGLSTHVPIGTFMGGTF